MGLTSLVMLVAVVVQPAAAWWGYVEGYVSGKGFGYVRCWDGRTVPAYNLRIGYGYPYDDGPVWVGVYPGDYWSHPLGSRWGGYPRGGFC